MELDYNRLEQLWRTEFAEKFNGRPRLQRLIKDTEVDFAVVELEEGVHMPTIRFYADNTAQSTWIEMNALDEMQDTFATLAGLELLTLCVEVKN